MAKEPGFHPPPTTPSVYTPKGLRTVEEKTGFQHIIELGKPTGTK